LNTTNRRAMPNRPASAGGLGREGAVGFLTSDQPDGVLQLVVLLLLGRNVNRGADRRLFLGAAADLPVEAGLADDLVASLEFLWHVLGDGDVGLDPRRLDGAVGRRVVAGRRQ